MGGTEGVVQTTRKENINVLVIFIVILNRLVASHLKKSPVCLQFLPSQRYDVVGKIVQR